MQIIANLHFFVKFAIIIQYYIQNYLLLEYFVIFLKFKIYEWVIRIIY